MDITNLIIKLKKIDQLLIGLLCLIIIVGLFTVASSEKLAQSIIMAQLINIFVGVSSMLLIILSGCGQKGPLLITPETDDKKETKSDS